MTYDPNESRRLSIMNKDYWTTGESSFYLTNIKGINTTEKTLRTMITRGGGPRFFKFGRQIRYTKTTLDLWIATRMSGLRANSLDKGGENE